MSHVTYCITRVNFQETNLTIFFSLLLFADKVVKLVGWGFSTAQSQDGPGFDYPYIERFEIRSQSSGKALTNRTNILPDKFSRYGFF